ncbi:MAG: hypothetical protein KIG59_07575, partial [Muribaculaceae bacterium]|nr:hypothetical protein [Muribaculaceae bacterium]
ERDLNPHSRNGQRILSPSCLPFHHPSSTFHAVAKKHGKGTFLNESLQIIEQFFEFAPEKSEKHAISAIQIGSY